MNFAFYLFIFAFTFETLGYLISKTKTFKSNRVFRISSYFIVVLLTLIISVILSDYFKFKEVAGIISACVSYWFYFGTRVNNDIQKSKKLFKSKRIFGVILIVFGVLTLIFFILDLTNYTTKTEFLVVHFFIGISQVVFGYSLRKPYPFKNEIIINKLY